MGHEIRWFVTDHNLMHVGNKETTRVQQHRRRKSSTKKRRNAKEEESENEISELFQSTTTVGEGIMKIFCCD